MGETVKFSNLKEMLKNSENRFSSKAAFILQDENGNRNVTYKEFAHDVNSLGTALIEMGLKDKRIAIISENRYEWEMAYLAVANGTGIVVPFDKALPENEIESLILRSEVEAIFYSEKYEKTMAKIQKQGNSKLKYFISMDLEKNEFNKFSQKEIITRGRELIKNGNRQFLDAIIDDDKMGMMLFTSGTTSISKAVMLSHKNICTNVKDIASIFELDETDSFLSFLPLHHTFECTVGFLYPISIGTTIVFSKGVRHIADELRNFHISSIVCVPVVFEKMYQKILQGIEAKGKLGTVKKASKLSNILLKVGIDLRKKLFKEIQDNLGGRLRMLVAGGAALNPEVEKGFVSLGFNLLQGYGLTETSPVIATELTNKRRLGSVGKKLPSIEVKLEDVDDATGIGELLVKGDSVMLGYYENEEANREVFTSDGWLKTGDYAKIDKDGFIYISGRKKFVIVLQNGKNVYPEEIEILINNIPEVLESMVYGMTADDGSVTVSTKVCYDSEYIKQNYGDITEDKIKDIIWAKIKEINRTMPKYKYVKKLLITDEEFEKTTTHKIKRKVETDKILQMKM